MLLEVDRLNLRREVRDRHPCSLPIRSPSAAGMGPGRIRAAVAGAWDRFAPWTDAWLSLRHAGGASEVETACLAGLEGRIDPRTADLCGLGEAVHD